MATANSSKAASAKAAANAPTRQRQEIKGLDLAFPPAIKFDAIGESHSLLIASAKMVQAREFETQKLRYWPSGDPMMQLAVIGTDADGHERTLFVQGAALNDAFKASLKAAGVSGIAPGDTLSVSWIGEEEVSDKDGNTVNDKDGNPLLRKLYDVALTV